MSSILGIDLDYFRFLHQPLERLDELMSWADRPADAVLKDHHEALEFWTRAVKTGVIAAPRFILHVDQHHDMLGDRPPVNPGNFIYFAMRRWAQCRVHWLVEQKIDAPPQWLSEDAWASVAPRFSSGTCLHRRWRKPDMVTICTSPDFVGKRLCHLLTKRIRRPTLAQRSLPTTPKATSVLLP